MKTLKEELQQVLDEKKLAYKSSRFHICSLLSTDNKYEMQQYFEMSKKYAPKRHTNNIHSCYGWWQISGEKYHYVLRQKYRFIRDLIKILP